jgi:hypothetical protein
MNKWAVLVGHNEQYPGSKDKAVTYTEYEVNHSIVEKMIQRNKNMGGQSMIAIDTPGYIPPEEIPQKYKADWYYKDHIQLCKDADVDLALSIHHNHFDPPFNISPAVMFYWCKDLIALKFCQGMRETLFPLLRKVGVKRFDIVGIPHPQYGNIGFLRESFGFYSAAILEAAFLCEEHSAYFNEANFQIVADVVYDYTQNFHRSNFAQVEVG